ncbi:MAG: hypothetical protein H8E31_12600 [Planctomycetes bacterium]|nr:hypothetical protein [Planctomycetota bacterium]
MRRHLLLLLLPLLAACQASGPQAGFQYRSNAAWTDAHPRTGAAGESQTWQSPSADLRLWSLPAGVGLHLHRDREEWLMVVDGHGLLRVWAVGACLVAAR